MHCHHCLTYNMHNMHVHTHTMCPSETHTCTQKSHCFSRKNAQKHNHTHIHHFSLSQGVFPQFLYTNTSCTGVLRKAPSVALMPLAKQTKKPPTPTLYFLTRGADGILISV